MKAILFRWNGQAMEPATGKWELLADEQFVMGQRYFLREDEARSIRSHRQYFASLNEAFDNLPEELKDEYPTPEHLRKTALIFTGFYTESAIAAKSDWEAYKLSTFIAGLDEYAQLAVRDHVVVVRRAKSQKMRDMGKAEFQKSKDAVLDYAWSLCGVGPDEWRKNEGKAA